MEVKSHYKIQLKYDPNTLIKFPPEMKPTEEGSGTFVDVRIGCSICSRGYACTMDVRPSKDYYSDFIPLKDIDLRMPYYNHDKSLEEMDANYLGETEIDEIWYVWKNPEMEYVYKLRNMVRILHESSVNTFNGGVSYTVDSNQITNYYGSKEIPDPDNDKFWCYHFIDGEEITLCPGCYMWSSYIYPENKEKFIPLNQFDLGYEQWLEEYEDKLIIK
ncbi:hypothetical protein H012_gp254 [Acanthamoeba polyphaga moumouvirus]|uniref:Uncharacterized protein n=1 Tax=Acanthamoeba polyphaga moumouvirus TaxID=1269028 RepID=L7RCA4_9VIRU|nr:hypothetical protein H012_gp254 [Acanthamoeba polyphaga moumouvirus]AGC02199.1 hypothetical protein Moumou_00677 [Acanthamoeba polyphaga moumouvirus]